MKKIITLFSFLTLLMTLQSCGNSSKEIFDRAVLNSNVFTKQFNKSYFLELKSTYKENKSHTYSSAVEFLNGDLTFCKAALEKVKNLSKTDDSQELIESSEDYMSSALNILENDHMNVAKMIDAKKPEAEVDAAIEKIYVTHDASMKTKYDRLTAAATKYANENNIEFIAR